MKLTEDKNYYVYMHNNKINGKKYIGITGRKPTNRWGKNGNNYQNHPHFWSAIKKYGWDNFEHKIIRDNLSQTEAESIEKWLIKKFKTYKREYGYNVRLGGNTKVPYVVFQYDAANGYFINKYQSSAVAAECLDLLQRQISLCCMGVIKTYSDYYFTYQDYGILLPNDILISLRNQSYVSLAQYDLLGRFLKVYKKIEDAAKLFNGSRPNLTASVSLGYIWKRVDAHKDNSYEQNLTIEELDVLLKDYHGRIECCKYDTRGHFICAYPNAKQAADDMGCTPSTILTACNAIDGYSIGYIWRFLYQVQNYEDLAQDHPSVLAYPKHNHTVLQYDPNGTFIQAYASVADAEKYSGVLADAIKMSAYMKYKHTDHFLWRYEKDGYERGKPLPQSELSIPKRYKPVSQFTLDNQYVATYVSAASAARAIGKSRCGVKDCCNGYQKTAYGYIWRFATEEEIQKQIIKNIT